MNMRVKSVSVVVVILVFLSVVNTPQTKADSWWNYDWQYRLPVTIDNTGGPLTDYQVKVALDLSFDYSKAKTNGEDIRFIDSNNNVLSYWIEKWNASGDSTIWVKIPSIPIGGTTIYMYYGNPSASSASNGASTFELYNVSGVVGFWHMDEDSWDGTTGEVKDETGVNDGTAKGGVTTADGKFGKAGDFDGADDYIEVPDSTSLNITQGTWEAWLNFSAKPSDTGHPMNPSAKEEQYWMHGSRNDPNSGTTDAIVAKINIGGTRYCSSTSSNFIETDVWYHVAGTYDGETLKLYVNGELKDSNINPSGDIATGDKILAIGTWSSLIDYFQGIVDEVRIYNRDLNASEISIIYNNYMEKMGSYYNVRKYTHPEPTTTLGSEQGAPTVYQIPTTPPIIQNLWGVDIINIGSEGTFAVENGMKVGGLTLEKGENEILVDVYNKGILKAHNVKLEVLNLPWAKIEILPKAADILKRSIQTYTVYLDIPESVPSGLYIIKIKAKGNFILESIEIEVEIR